MADTACTNRAFRIIGGLFYFNNLKSTTMTKLLDNIPTKEWVHARMHYLGGSELAAAFGKSKYQTPLQLWMIKTGRI